MDNLLCQLNSSFKLQLSLLSLRPSSAIFSMKALYKGAGNWRHRIRGYFIKQRSNSKQLRVVPWRKVCSLYFNGTVRSLLFQPYLLVKKKLKRFRILWEESLPLSFCELFPIFHAVIFFFILLFLKLQQTSRLTFFHLHIIKTML